jgi:hypothetical protein
MAARGNARDGNLLRNNDDVAAAIVIGKGDNAGQEDNNPGGNSGEDNKDNGKWWRGTLFNSSSSLLSSVVGHLVSNAIASVGLLLSDIAVHRINVHHRNSLRPRRRRTLSVLTKR